MAREAIKLYIANDVASVVSTTASGVQALNSDLWETSAQVPSYAYRSFGQIWIGGSAASGELANRIVYKMGSAEENALGEITLLCDEMESVDLKQEGLQTNEAGGESMYLDIVLRLPDTKKDYDRIVNAELRLRYLLDENWRKKRRGTTPYIPNLGDHTITDNVRLRWIRHLVPPNAKEVWTRYAVNFTRAVPRG